MISRRTIVNLVTFVAAAVFLVLIGVDRFILTGTGGRTFTVEFADATGVAPRNDVTVRGVPVGIVRDVRLTPRGTASVTVQLDPGQTVPSDSKAQLTRRSSIGDIVLEIHPGTGPPMAQNGRIPLKDTSTPPDPERTIQVLAQVLHAVPSADLTTLVHELANGVQGRGKDLASLSQTTADLPQRILEVQQQLQDLIVTGPSVTHVFADNANTLADDLKQTAALADILRDQRNNLVDLSKNGASFANVANDLISGDKANLACLIADLGTVNSTLAQDQNLRNLETTLELNHYFFDGVWQLVQPGKDGLSWFRVQLLPGQQPPGQAYPFVRLPPDVYGADSCQSIYGNGVGPGSQPGPLYLAPGSHYHPGM
ncbi:MAG TPA: MlaD family protein [Candidatus Dormibacteraeota bacterium]|nr:MlaD family protein [Candidatus Dormibacteraeota bacterium]